MPYEDEATPHGYDPYDRKAPADEPDRLSEGMGLGVVPALSFFIDPDAVFSEDDESQSQGEGPNQFSF